MKALFACVLIACIFIVIQTATVPDEAANSIADEPIGGRERKNIN